MVFSFPTCSLCYCNSCNTGLTWKEGWSAVFCWILLCEHIGWPHIFNWSVLIFLQDLRSLLLPAQCRVSHLHMSILGLLATSDLSRWFSKQVGWYLCIGKEAANQKHLIFALISNIWHIHRLANVIWCIFQIWFSLVLKM